MSFKMTINMGNVAPSKSVSKDLVTGVYEVKINKMEGKVPTYDGKKLTGYKRGMWIFEVTSGEFSGSTCIHSMNVPKDGNDWICQLWLDSLLSCGYDMDAVLDMTEYDETVYMGRECYIQFTSSDDNGGQYTKVKFIKSEEDYLTLKERGSIKVKKKPVNSLSKINSSPKIEVSAPPVSANLNSLIDGIGEMPF
jgi:hypothetical protein